MAKVVIKNDCIQSISGKLGDVVYRTLKSGKVIANFYTPRSVPLSPAEIAARRRFAVIASEVARRRRLGDSRDKKIIWNEVKKELAAG